MFTHLCISSNCQFEYEESLSRGDIVAAITRSFLAELDDSLPCSLTRLFETVAALAPSDDEFYFDALLNGYSSRGFVDVRSITIKIKDQQ